VQTETVLMRESDDTTDADLFRAFLAGSRQAKCDFVRRWEAPMYRIAFRVVGQAADAEEVRQIVLLRMLQRPESLPKPQSIGAWIRRCVVNESLSLLRKRKRVSHTDDLETQQVASSEDCSDEAQQLCEALERLPAETRALLALRFDEGLTVREIADVVNKPRSTVHAKLQNAIESLRKKLNSNCEEN